MTFQFTYSIRPFEPSDVPQIAQLFHDTIRQVNINDYSEDQVKAWAPNDLYFRDWEKKCSEMHTFVAEDKDIIAGFAELTSNGYIDCFYCHMDFQGRGVGTLLFQTLHQKAIDLNIEKLFAEVSITAKPFFKKMGFTVEDKQTELVRGEYLTYYRMSKKLNPTV